MSSKEQLLTCAAFVEPEAVRGSNLPGTRMIASLFLWLTVVCLPVWLIGILLRRGTVYLDFSEPKLSEALAFHDQTFDILYLGDSLTLEGINAETVDSLLGTHGYNFALGGASILESEMQLRYFLAHNPKPRLVALGLYINQPNRPAGVRPGLYFSLPTELRVLYEDKLRNFEGMTIDRSFVAFNSLPAYRYRNTLDLLLKAALSSQRQRPTFVQGQAQVFFSRPASLGHRHDSTLNLAELRSLLSFCREQQLPVFLFEPPNHAGYSTLTRNRGALLSAIREMADGNTTLWFTSYADTGINYRSSEWVNLNHLNAAGSEKFGVVIAASLRQHLRPKIAGASVPPRP